MLNYIKNTFTNFASYMLELDKQLANAKDDATRVKILTQIAEVQRQRIEELDSENLELREENVKLKEQIKEYEELESVLSGGSSVSSAEDTTIDQNIKDLETLLLNSKKSTASVRTEMKLLKKIRKLKLSNHQKDKRIRDLEKNQKVIDLGQMTQAVNKLTETSNEAQDRIKGILSQVEIIKK